MNEIDIKFLEDSFKKYYFNHLELIPTPQRTSEREFGYQKFNSSFFNRHISLKNDKEFIISAAKINGIALKYASTELKNDKEVVMVAVEQSCDWGCDEGRV